MMATIEKLVCFSQIPRGGDRPCHARPHGEAPGLIKR